MNDCIYTELATNDMGYPSLRVNKKVIRASRFVYSMLNGAIPEGLVIDHKCHTEAVKNNDCAGGVDCKHRACINPAHLEAITQSENVMRGMHSIDNKLTCNQGHSYKDANNIMVRKNGKRECAECNRERARKNWANRFERAGA